MLVSLTIIEDYAAFRYFALVDTDFSCEVSVPFQRDGGMRTLAVVKEYGKRKLPIAKNVALAQWTHALSQKDPIYFQQKIWLGHSIMGKNTVENVYPELNYTNKYYPCVLRYLDYYFNELGK